MIECKKILLVDDEIDLVEIIAGELREKGFIVDLSHSGNEALKKLTVETYDVILSDLKMADGDGFFLLDQVKELNINSVFILMTAFLDTSRQEVIERGANDVIYKPLKLSVVNSLFKLAK